MARRMDRKMGEVFQVSDDSFKTGLGCLGCMIPQVWGVEIDPNLCHVPDRVHSMCLPLGSPLFHHTWPEPSAVSGDRIRPMS